MSPTKTRKIDLPMSEVMSLAAPPVVSLRAAQKEVLLQRVHDAARELFFRQGYSATTLDQIAVAAGVRRSTLYKHFRDKQDILRMIAGRYTDQILEVATTLQGPVPSRSQIDAWLKSIAGFIRRERTPTVLMNNLATYEESSQPMADIGASIVEGLAKNVTAFRRAVQPGPQQARASAWSLVIMREICSISLQQARESGGKVGRELFAIAGDLVETFVRETR
jgi:AcrR family transcriptional regulator